MSSADIPAVLPVAVKVTTRLAEALRLVSCTEKSPAEAAAERTLQKRLRYKVGASPEVLQDLF